MFNRFQCNALQFLDSRTRVFMCERDTSAVVFIASFLTIYEEYYSNLFRWRVSSSSSTNVTSKRKSSTGNGSLYDLVITIYFPVQYRETVYIHKYNLSNKVKEKHDSKEQKCFLLKDAASDLQFLSSIFKNSTCLWPELHDTRLLPERQWRSQRR